MQVNKIEYQVNDENEIESILIETILSNEQDEKMFIDLIETYSNEYNLHNTLPFIEYDKVISIKLETIE